MMQSLTPEQIREIQPGTWVKFECPVDGCTNKNAHKWLSGGTAVMRMPNCFSHSPPVPKIATKILEGYNPE